MRCRYPPVTQNGLRHMNTKVSASGKQTLPYSWEFPELIEMSYGRLVAAPLVAGDRLICVTTSVIFALDIYTGKEVLAEEEEGFPYRFRPSDPSSARPAYSRGLLYFVDKDELMAIQLSDGKPPSKLLDRKSIPRWKPPPVEKAVSVRANDNVVVVCQADPDTRVTGFDATNGSPLWGPISVSLNSPGALGITRDAIVFVSSGRLFAINIRSGDTRFAFAPAGPPDPLAPVEEPQVGEIGEKSVVVAAGTAVYGVDLFTGRQLWTQAAKHPSRNTQWLTPAISERYNRVVLANTDGDVFVLELTTGASRWSTQVAGVTQVKIVGDKVYAGSPAGDAQLHVYELATGTWQYTLNLDDVGRFGIVAGHGILFTPGETKIRALPFGDQNAALFNGRSSRITVAAQETQFDFREGDFTIETWICTTRGGEVLSGFPTSSGQEHHGFRVNVNEQGRLRFAVINKDASSSFAASSVRTNVADGSWHHVAVVRRGQGVEMYVDGISVEVETALKGSTALGISGKTSLTFGAFVPGAEVRSQSHFSGLMREMRLWDIALDASKLQSRMQRTLIGTEPHLLGYWRMNEIDISKLKNHVPRHVYVARPQNVGSFVTELALDASAFPYLLDQVDLQWPYAGHWSARGEDEITTSPALDKSGVLSFGAGNMLYGVHASDGTRAWSKATAAGCSAPLAADGIFYAITGAEGLISIDALTGAFRRVKEFEGLFNPRPSADTRLAAPATDGRYTAAASPEGNVWVVETANPTANANAEPWKWKAPAKLSSDLSIANGLVYFVAAQVLYQLDPANRKTRSFQVAGPHVLAQGDSVFCMQSAGTVVSLAASDLTKQKAAFMVPDGAAITGMAASRDDDLLVVATDKGKLYALTFATLAMRWETRIPAKPSAASHALNAPAINGRAVVCTSASGTVAALDARTGAFRGLFFEPTEIKSAPLVEGGTIYFGCADAAPEANLLDGALHSVVFGHTNVLRLGLDHTGARELQPAYASVTAGDILELLGVESCCVEAWINTKEGGEVFSICPSDKSRYGLRLWLDHDGTIHFKCVDLPDETAASWQRISASAKSPACDGKWHHIAVARSGRKELTIYLDGVPVTTETTSETIAVPLLSDGLKVFIGADATSPAAANFFAGMIGEIRVWDTFLTATRIAQRMHDKLIGNEPALLAYWNFDALSIHDGTRYGHDGKLETGGGSSGYWLAELNFTHPSYPYLETKGRVVQEGEVGATGDLANTIYELTVVARAADGAACSGHEITLWYVRHKGESGPDNIEASSLRDSGQLTAVAPEHGDEQSLTTTTGSDGKVVFRLTTTQRGHGPSLDLRPAFLPANERYHVSVLIDSQKLDRPSPPRLEAQAKLMQDYHWSTGDRVDHTRDRSTWRTVICALTADGRPRPGERFQLWSTEHVEVEVNGRVYPINPNNYQSFVADQAGELTVAMAATELRAPALSVWAGFMHRDERYTIPLDQEAHQKLAQVKPVDLAEPRMTNWKPGYDPAKDGKAVVKEGYKPHAAKVATAIKHVMSVTQEPAVGPRSGTKRAALRVDNRNFSDMRQAAPTSPVDRVRSLRTLKHIERQVPLEAGSLLRSLGKTKGFEDSIGFIFTKGELELRPIKTLADVAAEFPRTPQQQQLLGNIFEDAWNTIESAAEAAWKEVQKIAVFIADQVKLVIQYADGIVEKVVNSVKEAVEAVVHILKMIEALIEDVIRILMLLFDWSGILETQRILKAICRNQLKTIKDMTAVKQKDNFQQLLTGIFRKSPGSLDLSNQPAALASGNRARQQDSNARVQGELQSVHGKYVDSKVDERKDEVTVSGDASFRPVQTPTSEGGDKRVQKLTESLGGVLSNPMGAQFREIYDVIKDIISGDVSGLADEFSEALLSNFNVFGEVVTGLDVMLNAEIDIPFLSQLYKWITRGNTLTLLDVSCLALAIPTHVGYGVFTLIACGEVRRFSEDAIGLTKLHTPARQLWDTSITETSTNGGSGLIQPRADGNLTAPRHDLALHWSYFAFHILYTFGSQALKGSQLAKGIAWRADPTLKFVVPIFIAEGLVAKSLLFTAGMKEERWDDLEQGWNSTKFAFFTALDLYTCYDALLGVETGEWTTTKKVVQEVKCFASLGGCVLLILRLKAWILHESDVSDLFHTRGLLEALTLILTFYDTPFYSRKLGPAAVEFLLIEELVLKIATGGVHVAAVIVENKSEER